MQHIKNLKTTKSYKQKKDKLIALKAKKQFHLKNTDWTQLPDVNISNLKEITDWRDNLRNLKVIDADLSEKKLNEIINAAPEPITERDEKDIGITHGEPTIDIEEFNNLKENFSKMQDQLEKIKEKSISAPSEPPVKEPENEEILLDVEQAKTVARELFTQYKNKRLIDAGVLEYNMMRALLEEAIDRRISPDNHAPLLEEYLKLQTDISNEDVIEKCRKFFKNINVLYITLTKEARTLYNMSPEELDNWFKQNGHRYRCYDKN